MSSSNKYPNQSLGIYDNLYSAMKQILQSYFSTALYTCMPVAVKKVNNDGTVNVKPLLRNLTVQGTEIPIDDGSLVYNVPYMQFIGKKFNFTIEASAGDKGLLIACMKDISVYKKTHAEANIGSRRTFSPSDGVFLPLDFASEKGSAIKFNNGSAGLEITDSGITVTADTVNITATTVNLGGEGGQGVARIGDSVDLNSGKIISGSAKVKAE